jgi:hypothetical protein
MKTKKIELDVDFIGGQTSLTKEEEKTISEYIKKIEQKKPRSLHVRPRPSSNWFNDATTNSDGLIKCLPQPEEPP